MTILSDTAYHSFIGEVEALNTTTIRRLTRSRRHQLLAIAQDDANLLFCGKLPPSGTADLPDNLLRRFLCRPGFLSHLRSLHWLRWARNPPFLNLPFLSHRR